MDKYLTYFILGKDNMPIELIIDDTVPLEVLDVRPEKEKEMLNKSSSLILYHLRITFEPLGLGLDSLEEQKIYTKGRLRDLEQYTDKWIAGIEHFKKGCNPCKAHVHILFLSYTKKDTIRKQLIRLNGELVGNKAYSLKAIADQNIKAFRYPLKQQKNETHRWATVSPAMKDYVQDVFGCDVQRMRDEAYAVWQMACEVSNAKEEKEEQANMFMDRLFRYLDKVDFVDDLDLKVRIQKFYIVEEKKPFNKTTALGYFYNYQIHRGLITHEYLASKW